ncbi:MarR family winged helix-turn-helix transcriptional regulator [Pyxidicoccus xibeiensis]|uniref:MarR family winged helix-turn-helix transcriptional regulator n=1 Tax=Pyxidicoccus xibeiensis TaxID=2906759 RepID=UPI0020A7E0A7|nr:MarR family transcriptional regulator [Pyxidicoccus xibeiensis]MCP3140123.1 MarR family transcriptional regulator [Pyxidicoccus xibeiensis]
MPRPKDAATVQLEALDLGYLALFVGQRVNEQVLEDIHAAGFTGLRHAHGYVFQHLLGGPRSISELAGLLEVTQQAASKSVAELEGLGYVEKTESGDARVRRVALSARGLAAVEKTRAVRAGLQKRFERQHGARAVEEARKLLAAVLSSLGGAEAVRTRRVRQPR